MAIGEIISNPRVSRTHPDACGFFRCKVGQDKAIENIMEAGMPEAKAPSVFVPRWKISKVDTGGYHPMKAEWTSVPTPVLDATTYYGDNVLKAGHITDEGLFVVEHPEGSKQLWTTGQTLMPKQLNKEVQEAIRRGVKRSRGKGG
jgi:hypothetical protein